MYATLSHSAIPEVLAQLQGVRLYRNNRLILDGLTLDIPQGQVTAILGPSGTGKTTLLHLLAGLLRPQAGQVMLAGQNLATLSRPALYRLRMQMGMLFQSNALLTDLSVFDNVALPLREHSQLPASLIRRIVLLKLQAVGLRGAQALYPHQLSGGMARRVALARAVALDPMLVLYDEPFTGQDPISMGILVKLIRALNDAAGMTSVVVSHDVRETCAIADWVYVLAEGRVLAQGTPAEVLQHPSPWVQQFLQGLPDGPLPFHYPAPPLATELLH